MHRLSILVLLLALCAVSHGYGYGRRLKQGSSASADSHASSSGGGGAFSSVDVQAGPGGRVSGSSSADSRARSKARSRFIHYCQVIYNQKLYIPYNGGPKGPWCVNAFSKIKDEVVAYGKASASAYASTSATVIVEGEGSGCAGGSAQASAEARAYAALLAKAAAVAKIGKFKARAEASGAVVSHVLVQAFADSYSEACASSDSYASAYQETHARAIGLPVATFWIHLFAGVDCQHEVEYARVVEATAKSSVQTETTVVADTTTDSSDGAFADAGGTGQATATQRCRGNLRRCCNRRPLRRGRCTCSFFNRCDATLKSNVRKVWEDKKSGQTCHC